MLTVKIVPCDTNNPPGKLADAELHFVWPPDGTVQDTSPTDLSLNGLKLIGFAVWERRGTHGNIDHTIARNVTFPARQYSVNGERRNFALLRPIADASAQQELRDVILAAYADYEREAAASAQASA